jgi:hypothetical protein
MTDPLDKFVRPEPYFGKSSLWAPDGLSVNVRLEFFAMALNDGIKDGKVSRDFAAALFEIYAWSLFPDSAQDETRRLDYRFDIPHPPDCQCGHCP